MVSTRALKNNPAEKKEHSQDRRRRLDRDRRAKDAAQRFVIPTILAGLALFVIIFFWKYGFGGVRPAAIK